MKLGMKDHLIQPRYLLEKVAIEAQDIADTHGMKSSFAFPLAHYPSSITLAEQQTLTHDLLATIEKDVLPAYVTFAAFMRDTYAPAGRTEPGIWALPNGDALYKQAIREHVQTTMDADAIFNEGMREVEEITTQMLALAKTQGFNDLASFHAHINADPKLHALSGEQLLKLYAGYEAQSRAKLNQIVPVVPTLGLEVVPIVVGDTLYILAGRNEVPPNVNDFIMKEWQLFATEDVDSHQWRHYPAILKPAKVFAWASPEHACAGQIIAPMPPAPPTRNLAPATHASASNEPVPLQYWINALNDGIVRVNPLPPDMWASWTPHNPPSQWILYTWPHPVKLPAGASEGIAPPATWHLEYLADGEWHPIEPASGYPVSATDWMTVTFRPIETTSLRAVFETSGSAQEHAAIAVQEWEALTPK